MPDKVYRTAIYCRLSREDGDKVESNSIASQRAICEDYIARHEDLELVCVSRNTTAATTRCRPCASGAISHVKGSRCWASAMPRSRSVSARRGSRSRGINCATKPTCHASSTGTSSIS